MTKKSIADLLGEKAGEIERALPEDKVLHSAIRMACVSLRGKKPIRPVPEEDLRRIVTGWEQINMELVCYVEYRKSQDIQATIIRSVNHVDSWYKLYNTTKMFDLRNIREYGKSWRVWLEYPRSNERNAEWTNEKTAEG